MAVALSYMLRIFIVCVMCLLTHSARVLVIPQNTNSHLIYLGRAASSLASEGHLVTMLASTNVRIPDFLKSSHVEIALYKAKRDVPFVSSEECSEIFVNSTLAETLWQKSKILSTLNKKFMENWKEECHDMLDDSSIQELMDTREYDIAIMDVTGLSCMSALPFNYKIPMIHLGIMQVEWIFRVPSLPSMLPNVMSDFGSEMTFSDRLLNTLFNFGHNMLMNMMNIYTPSNPPQTQIQMYENGIFFFILDDPVIDYPRPIMPNMEYIGDLIPQPPKQLPECIDAFVSSAREGVIIVSFGSFFDFLPEKFASIFCRVFHNIPQKIIWKLKNRALCTADSEKVLVQDWLPQNDLLAHENVKLFISHCGVNSVLESIYHGTPILGLPLAIDQPYNALRVQNKGLGVRLNLRDLTDEELTSAIASLIADDTILLNVKRASDIMKHKQIPPQQRISYWVEHLVTHGHEHLKTNAFKLNMFQFYCLDVLLVILGGIILLLAVLFYCIKCTFRCAKSCCCKQSTKKNKIE